MSRLVKWLKSILAIFTNRCRYCGTPLPHHELIITLEIDDKDAEALEINDKDTENKISDRLLKEFTRAIKQHPPLPKNLEWALGSVEIKDV